MQDSGWKPRPSLFMAISKRCGTSQPEGGKGVVQAHCIEQPEGLKEPEL